jgi:hypothetical protein
MPRRVLAPQNALHQTGSTKRKRSPQAMDKIERDLFQEFTNSTSQTPSYGAADYSDIEVSPDSAFDSIEARLNILDSRDEILARRIKNLENMVLILRSEVDNLKNGAM